MNFYSNRLFKSGSGFSKCQEKKKGQTFLSLWKVQLKGGDLNRLHVEEKGNVFVSSVMESLEAV